MIPNLRTYPPLSAACLLARAPTSNFAPSLGSIGFARAVLTTMCSGIGGTRRMVGCPNKTVGVERAEGSMACPF
jgi:hypothetical protein